MGAIVNEAWFALRADNGANKLTWRSGSPDFNSRLYHGFAPGEPNSNTPMVCVRLTATGWKDNACTSAFVRLCERE
jgi:hypothetical protein